MKKNLRALVLLTVLIGFPSLLLAEESNSTDFRIWAKAGVKFNIAKGLSNTTDLELRTKNNSSKVDVYRLNTSFNYKVCNYFSMAAGYAMINKPVSGGDVVISNRYWVDAIGTLKISDFTISLRERFQQTFAVGSSVGLWRNQLKGQYQIRNSIFKPYLSCETHVFLFQSTEGRVHHTLKGMKELWIEAGTSIAINKNNDLQIWGRYTRNINQIITPNHCVLGVSYYYKF